MTSTFRPEIPKSDAEKLRLLATLLDLQHPNDPTPDVQRDLRRIADQLEGPTIEQMLKDLCYWEDPDAVLLISSTETGGAFVTDQLWSETSEAPTLYEALRQMWVKRKSNEK